MFTTESIDNLCHHDLHALAVEQAEKLALIAGICHRHAHDGCEGKTLAKVLLREIEKGERQVANG